MSDFTPISDIPEKVSALRGTYLNQTILDIDTRLHLLRNIYYAIKDNSKQFQDALYHDFFRSPSETLALEVNICLGEIIDVIKNLKKWAKPVAASGIDLAFKATNPYISKKPLGVVLIISPFNYPLVLSASPIIGAIAAGNSVLFKPSEQVPEFSKLFSKLMSEAIDIPNVFDYVLGGVQETTAVLEQKFDKIMYTGGGKVARIISAAAAKHLTPTLLELGGKSPAFVVENTKNLTTVANRIAWGKFTNGGQTCVAVDYVYVHKSLQAKLVDEIIKVTESMYPNLTASTSDYTHLINSAAFKRISTVIENTKGDIVFGGLKDSDPESNYIKPTIINNASFEDSTMQEELFGPILPIIPYDDIDEAIHNVISKHDTPLATYIFTSNSSSPDVKKIESHIRTGALFMNDVIIHVGISQLPFGGVGESGNGAYHGRYSFDQFSHAYPILKQPFWAELMLKFRYPPFTEKNLKLLSLGTVPTAWFGRKGRVTKNWFFRKWQLVLVLLYLTYYFLKK